MGFKIILTPQAIEDLREIVAYIAQDNPTRAEAFGYELCEKVLMLSNHPFLGRVVPEFRRNDVRELVYKPYRIVYGVDESKSVIYVYHYWHGARQLRNLPQDPTS
ncbi:MAG TPA: type II toxin-antitoxin system RelE/ParE family toxin [Candidatus Binatia bacterium]|nr:type II toxin-antitoxin system RelE/ParE family toxin [Candidatus Binatia bacterium]